MTFSRAAGRTWIAAGLAALLASWPGMAQEAPAPSPSEWTIIHAGTLLAVPGRPPSHRQSILIRDGRIVEVRDGFAGAQDIGATASRVHIVDLSTKFVMPGLIDAHTHLTDETIIGSVAEQALRGLTATDADWAIAAVGNARTMLLKGFTTVRDLGARNGIDRALKRAIESGEIIGPRMLTAGASLGPTGSQGDPKGYRPELAQAMRQERDHAICDGPYECRQAVRAIVRDGNDVVKIKSSGGVSVIFGRPDPRLLDDELRAMVQTAHSLGVKVAAHAISSEGVKAALRAGVDSIEHGTQIDAEAVRLFKRTGAYLVPTLLAPADFMASAPGSGRPVDRAAIGKVWTQSIASVERAHAAGVPIAFGSDVGFSEHDKAPREFLYLVEAGLTPMEAITAATVNGADLLGLSNDIGTIQAGRWADVIATDRSPIEDISEMLRVSFVMKGGHIYKSSGAGPPH